MAAERRRSGPSIAPRSAAVAASSPVGSPRSIRSSLAAVAAQDSDSASANRRRRLSLAQDSKEYELLASEIGCDYEIQGVLGKGSYGTVYRCKARASGEIVAIKAVDLHSERINTALQEVYLMQKLHHGNLVALKRVMRTESHLYIVMELCEAELRDVMKDLGGRLSEPDARLVMSALLDGVAYMHSHHVVHRDLKPQNILLATPRDLSTVKISDFGLSVRMDGEALDRQCGTPAFMAPEMIDGHELYTEKCDVWSLGVTMFNLLVGSVPFAADTRERLNAAISAGIFSVPDGVSLSVSARHMLGRMLKVNPLERYSASDARKHPWLSGATTDTHGGSLLDVMAAWRTRQRLRRVLLFVFAATCFRLGARARHTAGAPVASTAAHVDAEPRAAVRPPSAADDEPPSPEESRALARPSRDSPARQTLAPDGDSGAAAVASTAGRRASRGEVPSYMRPTTSSHSKIGADSVLGQRRPSRTGTSVPTSPSGAAGGRRL